MRWPFLIILTFCAPLLADALAPDFDQSADPNIVLFTRPDFRAGIDSDRDGSSDTEEWKRGSNPSNKADTPFSKGDTDRDGVSNSMEESLGSDPQAAELFVLDPASGQENVSGLEDWATVVPD